MNDLIFIAMLCTSGLINLSSFDDALIDLLAFGIARASLATRRAVLAEVPTVGVFVANWHEEDVLARMVEGNLARIAVPTVRLYLGVYPNDTGTCDVLPPATSLQTLDPSRAEWSASRGERNISVSSAVMSFEHEGLALPTVTVTSRGRGLVTINSTIPGNEGPSTDHQGKAGCVDGKLRCQAAAPLSQDEVSQDRQQNAEAEDLKRLLAASDYRLR